MMSAAVTMGGSGGGRGLIGELIGNFRVTRRLGAGGMGEVWLAEHKDIHTKVAIKLLLPHVSAHKEHVQRFFNEAVAVSKIKHAGIAKIFDVGFRDGGEAYLVMEFLDGEPLSSRIARQGTLPLERAFDIARQIATVLEATHDAGIIHRDLKPDNVFLIADAELDAGERVKVLDFGIAKLGGDGMTHTGGTMGTPTYMSPEQWKSSARVDGRADLYSLGCLVFEMLCGRPPFIAESIGELCTLHLHDRPPALSTMTPGLPREVDELVQRLLAKQPDQRPSSREIKAVLATLMAGGAAASRSEMSSVRAGHTTLSASAMSIAAPRSRRRRSLLLATGAIALAAGGATVMLGTRQGDDGPSPPPAPVEPAVAPPTSVRETRLVIEATPRAAEILLDGARVTNPFRGTVSRSSTQHHVEVSAPGYAAESRWITFDDDRELVIPLVLEPSPSAPAPPDKPRAASATATRPPVTKRAPSTSAAPVPKPVPEIGSAAAVTPPPPPPPSSGSAERPTYKGTKGKIITEYPPK
jgi:eukaryotic-like serine/threonine-protein kinase